MLLNKLLFLSLRFHSLELTHQECVKCVETENTQRQKKKSIMHALCASCSPHVSPLGHWHFPFLFPKSLCVCVCGADLILLVIDQDDDSSAASCLLPPPPCMYPSCCVLHLPPSPFSPPRSLALYISLLCLAFYSLIGISRFQQPLTCHLLLGVSVPARKDGQQRDNHKQHGGLIKPCKWAFYYSATLWDFLNLYQLHLILRPSLGRY